MTKASRPAKTVTPSTTLESFISEFDPKVAKLIRACRTALRKMFPCAVEQVYDNYDFLAIGFCTTENTSDCIVSLACSAKGVALSFYEGASLADPEGLLEGTGKQNRYIRIDSAALLDLPAVVTLIENAELYAPTPFLSEKRGYTMIKSVSANKRPRR